MGPSLMSTWSILGRELNYAGVLAGGRQSATVLGPNGGAGVLSGSVACSATNAHFPLRLRACTCAREAGGERVWRRTGQNRSAFGLRSAGDRFVQPLLVDG